jgi:hypothetical protein
VAIYQAVDAAAIIKPTALVVALDGLPGLAFASSPRYSSNIACHRAIS